ncbi:MAG: bifunctional folylpolyglutamate synthase/dihydrofolate synthase [Flavobacteriales bacterium]|nr:bifunctional folylpolyglutamate synthase/dihydrofolate synthase [Flavobacteriales bacterium]
MPVESNFSISSASYKDTLKYLFDQLPMYQRIGKAAYKADLQNTIDLCDALGNPQNDFRSIHIAGTNGKGSVAHMLASVLQESGLKVGLYTSPHYKDFRERVRINGEVISEEAVVSFVDSYKSDFERIQPSFFEMTVGLAFEHFKNEKVDIAILETGMGGRLDSTNIVTPVLSIITNIGLDHTQFLGDTLEKIAAEKAGIMKKNVPVLIGERQTEIEETFQNFAENVGTPIHFSDLKPLGIHSGYQMKNEKTVVSAVELLSNIGFSISEKDLRNGLQYFATNTGFVGRWQLLSTNPTTICDAGHNEDGIKEVLKLIDSGSQQNLHFVLGTVNDKEIANILKLLPTSATYYFCQADIPRALDVNDLKEQASTLGLKGEAYSSVQEALKFARMKADVNDLVFVGGSSFVVAEVV